MSRASSSPAGSHGAWAAATRGCWTSPASPCCSTCSIACDPRSAASPSTPTAIPPASRASACPSSPTRLVASSAPSPASSPACAGRPPTHPRRAGFATAAGDAPLLPTDLVARLLAAAGERERAIPLAQSNGELHPVIGLWPVALADDLEAQLAQGVRKVLHWTDRHGTIPVTVHPRSHRRGRDRPVLQCQHAARARRAAGTGRPSPPNKAP